MARDLVFLLDFDNTLVDNDRAKADLGDQVECAVGHANAQLFWSFYEQTREERSFVDVIDTLARFQKKLPHCAGFPALSAAVLGHPRHNWLFRGARQALAHLRESGATVILSDGDPLWQPAKIARARLDDVLDGVVVVQHKEKELETVLQLFPAEHYVLVDDKERLLADVKALLGARVSTVHVLQGHYGQEDVGAWAGPDLRLTHIGQLRRLDPRRFA